MTRCRCQIEADFRRAYDDANADEIVPGSRGHEIVSMDRLGVEMRGSKFDCAACETAAAVGNPRTPWGLPAGWMEKTEEILRETRDPRAAN